MASKKKPKQGAFVFPNREPIARNVDPHTSHQSAELLTQTGARSQLKIRVLAAVQAHPGLTSRELARASGIANEILHKRLPDLKRDGLLCTGEARRCQQTGRQALTWYPRKEGEACPEQQP